MPPAGDQVGTVFAIEGKVVGLDLFDAPETLRKLFPKLLRSYGLDALDQARSDSVEMQASSLPSEAMASALLRKVMEAKAEEFPAVGEGVDVQLSGRNLNGAALVADDHVVHLSAFSMGD